MTSNVRAARLRATARVGRTAVLLAFLGEGCIREPDQAGSADAGQDAPITGTGTGGRGQTTGMGGQGGTGTGTGGQTVGTGGQGGTGGQTTGTGGAQGATGGGAGQTGGTGAGGRVGTGGGGSAGRVGTGGGGNAATGGTSGRGAGGQTAGTGGTGGAAGGAGTGGATGAASCTNNKKDGTETGVDCGGTCPACVNYKIGAPNKMNNAQSGCQGGPGFMCTRSMLFSPEFKQAAMDDWNMPDPPFVYGTVGHDPDTGGIDGNGNTCCQCYQLVFESPIGASGLPVPKPMIVQTFNTAAGGGKKFDIYMAVGGYGANNGCFGGANPMYSGFPDVGGNYAGGVKAGRYSQCAGSMGAYTAQSIGAPMCQDYVSSQCQMIKASASANNERVSQASCIESNYVASHYHMNWNVRAKRIECPANLTRVTGCKLNSQGLPAADPAAKDAASADSSYRTGYSTTTMQDCCRPTCAWPTNVANADGTWSIFYTCDKAGNPAQ